MTVNEATRRVAGKRVMMGVSLSSRHFSVPFVEWVLKLLQEGGARSLEIVLFELCESINYEVFRGFPKPEALERASTRAGEIRRGFQKVMKGLHLPAQVLTESELCHELGSALDKTHAVITRAYAIDGPFRIDVCEQVNKNLAGKLAALDMSVGHESLDQIAEYLLRELAVFDCYFRSLRADVEVYPGESLFVKTRLWEGKYEALGAFVLPERPLFLNLHLVEGGGEC